MKEKLIINEVCKYFGENYNNSLINSYNRETNNILIRYYSYLFLKKYTKISLYNIGIYFNKNHSTVINGLKKINNWIDTDFKKQEIYDIIKLRIETALNGRREFVLKNKIKYRKLKNQNLHVIKHALKNTSYKNDN